MHPGNLNMTTGPDGSIELISIDNDMSAGKLMDSHLASIATPTPIVAEWDLHLASMTLAASKEEPSPQPPLSVGKEHRLEMLAMTKESFLSRYAEALNPVQADRAWREMNKLKSALKHTPWGSSDLTIKTEESWEPTDIGAAHGHGLPRVISADLKNAILKLDAGAVKESMFGMLGLEEQEAAWSRVQKIQRLLELPGEVLVIDNPQKWTDTEVTERMGLNPAKLPSEAANMLKIESSWDARKATRAHAMQYGLPGSLGLGQAITLAQVDDKKAIPSHAALPAHDGAALFDQKRLRADLFDKKGLAQRLRAATQPVR